ncbi:hypothetical protein AKJ08_1557 [Vulgatibacter incomptus]|uniref:Uncharacterized protein n=1 Tax=Vulgatibacter incomptus TaxID=1391653 RepID=A0A0K1PCC4_9BACT|nr:hypothetical protein AKJ08_1557 [Vulgatibacter incomptus]
MTVVEDKRLRVRDASGYEAWFTWPRELPVEVSVGSEARINLMGDWQMIATEAGTLAVLRKDYSFGGRFGAIPGELSEVLLAIQCHFPFPEESPDDCRGPGWGRLFAVVGGFAPLSSPPAPVVVGPGVRAWAGGWFVENHGAIELPGGGTPRCVVEGASRGLITAYTTHGQLTPF